MKRVISFNIEKRKRDALLAFIKAVITASQSDNKVTAECSIQLAALIAAHDKMQELAEWHQMNLLTPEVQAGDDWRDANLSRFRAAVRAELKNPDLEKRKVAELLWKICEELGSVHNQGFDQQTGAMTTFCLDLENNHFEDMELLGLTDAFRTLKSSNEAFIQILAERTEIEGSYEKGSSQKARTEVINAYRDFVMKLNTLVSEGHYDELASFIDYLNAEIERQRIALGQGTANGGNNEGGENVVIYKTAKFDYFNGNSLRLKLAVGAPIEFPANTEGYYWVPTPPEFMPNKNLTFKEEPIAQEEGTATFHFLDHREEIIRQIVGTPLVGPANTVGCVWVPSVPATMPAGASSFFEELQNSSSTLFTVTWLGPNNEVLHVQEYEAGEHIVPPEPPAGYIWNYHPNYMPEENLVVNCLEDE